MSNALSLLVVSPEFPYPPIDGHKVRIYNLLRHLPDNCSFDFLGFGNSVSAQDLQVFRSRLGPGCKSVELVPESTLERVDELRGVGRLKNILFPSALSIGAPYRSIEMEMRIQSRVASGHYQILFFCGLYIFQNFDSRTTALPCLVDIGDSPSLLTWSYFKQECDPLAAARKLVDYVWATRYERTHAAKIENIVMITSVDAERISRNCRKSRIWVISNGVDAQQFNRGDRPGRSGAELLFTGVMDYPPNNSAMLLFITETLPLIRKGNPDVTLTIAGRNPTVELVSLANTTSGVRVTGFVDDLRPYFEAATVYVSPLLSGAGLKNKVLEAWSMMLPVVASSVSCSGMVASDNKNVLIADTPAEFASKVLMVLADSELRERLSVEGRMTVEREYSWSSRGAMLGSVLDTIVNRGRMAPGVCLSAQ